MSKDLDALLTQLATAPVHPDLANTEERVMTRVASLAARPEMAHPVRFGAVAAAFALVLGIGAANLAEQPAPTLSPFSASPPLAPSTLLAWPAPEAPSISGFDQDRHGRFFRAAMDRGEG